MTCPSAVVTALIVVFAESELGEKLQMKNIETKINATLRYSDLSNWCYN